MKLYLVIEIHLMTIDGMAQWLQIHLKLMRHQSSFSPILYNETNSYNFVKSIRKYKES